MTIWLAETLGRMSNGQARPIQKFSNRSITFESNQIGMADLNSNWISKLCRSLYQIKCS